VLDGNSVQSPKLSSYNGLYDKHLVGFFERKQHRKHLQMTGIIDRNGFIMKNADRQTGTLRLERNPFNLLFSDKAESLFPQAPLLN